jgi:hypothetical protein
MSLTVTTTVAVVDGDKAARFVHVQRPSGGLIFFIFDHDQGFHRLNAFFFFFHILCLGSDVCCTHAFCRVSQPRSRKFGNWKKLVSLSRRLTVAVAWPHD